VAFRGTHRGEFQGIPPTGKQVAFSSMEFNLVVDGKVEEHWVELDLFGLMQQLGAIPGRGTRRRRVPPRAAALQLLYSPNLLEAVFSEVRIRGGAYPHPEPTAPGPKHRVPAVRSVLLVTCPYGYAALWKVGLATSRTTTRPEATIPPSRLGSGSRTGTLAFPRSAFISGPPPNLRPTFTDSYISTSDRGQSPGVVDKLWISAD
jgi:SnoaL-like polyketide cyclase